MTTLKTIKEYFDNMEILTEEEEAISKMLDNEIKKRKKLLKKINLIKLDQNLSIVEATEKLEGEGLIGFSFSYRECEYDSWLQVEAYIPELNKVVIVDYEAPDCFDSIEDFVDILLLYEKEVERIRSKIKK